MPLRACGGGGEGICVGAPSAMSSAVSGTEFENTSALTRRSVGCYYPSVNCGPARRCLLPVLVPAEAWVRAEETTGTVLRGDGVLLPRFALVLCLPCSFIGMFCARSRILSRFCWDVLRLDYACCLTERQTGRLAICFVFIPRGSGAPFVRSRGGIGLSCFVGSLWDWTFLYGDPDGVRPESVYTKRSAVSSGASFVMACLFVMMPRGVRWGLRAPKPAPKSQCGSRTAASLDSPHLISGVGAFCAARIVWMRSVSARKPPRAFLYRRCRRSPSARSAGGPPEGRSALPCRKGCCRSTGGWARAGRRGTCQFPPSRP